jgi:hypothetical protein
MYKIKIHPQKITTGGTIMEKGLLYRMILKYGFLLLTLSLIACSGGGSDDTTPPAADDYSSAEAYFKASGFTIDIKPIDTTIELNKSVQYNATASGGIFKVDITNIASWTSLNLQTAIIDRKGKATGLNAGTAIIMVKYLNKSMSIPLRVFAQGASSAPKCIANLSDWKIKYRTDTLTCTQCHTTTMPRHSGKEGTPWINTNCTRCHEDPHEGGADD